jgi:hypothetical protein
MGYLNAIEMVPFLTLALAAGVWLDRMRRRPVLIAADILRAAVTALIPLLAAFGALHMLELYAVMLLIGVGTVFFDVAYQSYLPDLVGRGALMEGNAKVESTAAGASIAGPAVAGYLVQLLGAPLAVLADAVSYVVSVVSLIFIRARETPPAGYDTPTAFGHDLREGLCTITENPYLAAIAGCTATANFYGSAALAVFILYAVHHLAFSPGVLGGVFAVGSGGGLLGALAARAVGARCGLGTTIVGAALLFSLAQLAVPLAAQPGVGAVVLLASSQAVGAFGSVVYNVTQVSFRQTITPDRLLGRMNASMRFVVWGTIPIGSVLGGWLGTWIGLRPALVVAALGGILSVAWVFFSPVRGLTTALPTVEERASDV